MRVYDLVMTHKLDADDFFIQRIQFHAARLGLNFFLIEPLWVDAFTRAVSSGDVFAKVLLNMHSEHHHPEDPFSRLVQIVAQKQTRLIDPPDIALAAFDKASFHPRAIAAGLRVPYTVVVRNGAVESFQLTDEDRTALGSPFVIKPSLGYGRKGVVLDAVHEADLRRSAAAWPGSDYLLQRRMDPQRVGEWPLYFRIYYAFGSIWCNWWNCYSDQSRQVTPDEMKSLELHPLEEVARKLAEVSRMQFFSTEVLRTEAGEFVVIDYVNDQCHMLCQSSNPRIGVPDIVVGEIAQCLVEGASRMVRG
jgi:hypothetical protein